MFLVLIVSSWCNVTRNSPLYNFSYLTLPEDSPTNTVGTDALGIDNIIPNHLMYELHSNLFRVVTCNTAQVTDVLICWKAWIFPTEKTILTISFLLGFGDGIFQNQICSLIGLLYPKEEDAASSFAVFNSFNACLLLEHYVIHPIFVSGKLTLECQT